MPTDTKEPMIMTSQMQEVLNWALTDIGLEKRIAETLERHFNVINVEQLLQLPRSHLDIVPNLGDKGRADIEKCLAAYGFKKGHADYIPEQNIIDEEDDF